MTLDEAIEQGQYLLEDVAISHKAQTELTKQLQEWLAELRDRRELEE